MPDSKVDLVKSAYAAFGRGDIPGVLAILDEKVEWTLPDSIPFGGRYAGKAEVAKFFGKLPQQFQELKVEPQEYLASGDTVVARGQHRAKGKGGSSVIPFAMFWNFRGDKVVRFLEIQDTAKTMKTIGA